MEEHPDSTPRTLKLLKKFQTFNVGISFGIYYAQELGLLFTGGDWTVGDVKVWNANSFKMIKEFLSHDKWVSSILYIPTIKKLVTLGANDTINVVLKFWNPQSFTCEKEIHCAGEQFSSLRFLESKNVLLIFGKSSTIQILNLQTYSWEDEIFGPNVNFPVLSMVYLPEQDRLIFSTTKRGELYIYNFSSRFREKSVILERMPAINRLIYVEKLDQFICGLSDGALAVLAWKDNKKSLKLVKKSKITKLGVKEMKVSEDGKYLILSHGNQEITYYDLEDPAKCKTLEVFQKCGLGLTGISNKKAFAGSEFYGGAVSIMAPR